MEQEQQLNEEWEYKGIQVNRAIQCILVGYRELQSMCEDKHNVAIIKGYSPEIERTAREMLVLAQTLKEVGHNGKH